MPLCVRIKPVLLSITSVSVTLTLKETSQSPLRVSTTHPTGSQKMHRPGWEKQLCDGAGKAFPKFRNDGPWGKKGSDTLA